MSGLVFGFQAKGLDTIDDFVLQLVARDCTRQDQKLLHVHNLHPHDPARPITVKLIGVHYLPGAFLGIKIRRCGMTTATTTT